MYERELYDKVIVFFNYMRINATAGHELRRPLNCKLTSKIYCNF